MRQERGGRDFGGPYVLPFENGPIIVCHGLRRPLAEVWEQLQEDALERNLGIENRRQRIRSRSLSVASQFVHAAIARTAPRHLPRTYGGGAEKRGSKEELQIISPAPSRASRG